MAHAKVGYFIVNVTIDLINVNFSRFFLLLTRDCNLISIYIQYTNQPIKQRRVGHLIHTYHKILNIAHIKFSKQIGFTNAYLNILNRYNSDTTPTQKSESACRANNGILMRKLLTRILIYIIAQIIIHNKHKQRRNRRWCAAYSWSLFTGCVSREISSQPKHNDMIMYHDTVAVVPPYLMHSKITHRCTASGTGYGEIRQLCSLTDPRKRHSFPVMMTHLH